MIAELVISSQASHLSCSKCGENYSQHGLHHLSTCCQKPLIINYHDGALFDKKKLSARVNSMWRYFEMLPLVNPDNIITLGEGMTPILSATRLAKKFRLNNLYVKDEGLNPTGSFKARGMSMAISKAKELGIKDCVVPTAGNAGGAMSAYCSAAGINATIVMPVDAPQIFKDECRAYGAKLVLVEGLIDKCGEVASEIAHETGAFNMATLREPYRLEGKKTMGYEIAEQMNWQLPDIILYPTGGGTGLIGIWKAFQEMVSLGWIENNKLPKMIVVQSSNCSPVVDYIHGKLIDEDSFQPTIANGLAVPKVIGIEMIHQVVKESKGWAVTVSEQEILAGFKEFNSTEGISFSPEGGAIWSAIKNLIEDGVVQAEEKILLLNTGSGYKNLDLAR
jgi:threonine synthase